MASKLKVGGPSVTLQSSAQYPDPASADPANPTYLVDVDATIVWQIEPADGSVATLTDKGTSAGVGEAEVAPVAAGTATVQDYAVDKDGHATPLGDPYPVVVEAADSVTDATRVSEITEVAGTGGGQTGTTGGGQTGTTGGGGQSGGGQTPAGGAGTPAPGSSAASAAQVDQVDQGAGNASGSGSGGGTNAGPAADGAADSPEAVTARSPSAVQVAQASGEGQPA